MDDEYDHEYASSIIDGMLEQAKKDEEQGVVDEEGLSLAIRVIKVLLEVRTDELFQSLIDLGADKNPRYKKNTLNKIDQLIEKLSYFSRNHFLIYKTNYEKGLLATENLTNKLGLSVVLDATAQVNEYYQLANRFLGHVGFVQAPQIRQYQNLTIHKAKGFKQTRAEIYKQDADKVKEIAKSYASYVLNELVDNDKILIICHKDFSTAIKNEINDTRVVFTYWGNHVGRNDWSDCNKVMIIGWNFLPPIAHVATINSSLDSVLLTSRHLNDELINKFTISQLADDIVQGLMRSQARVIATDESDCKETSFYLFYNDDDMSKAVLDVVEAQFPLAQIKNWKPNGVEIPKKKSKPKKNADKVIELLILKAKDCENYLSADVQEELSINKSTFSRLLQSEYFQEELAKHGFTFKNKNGKSKQFILK